MRISRANELEALKTAAFKQGSFITIEDKEDSSEFFIVRSGKVQLMKETKKEVILVYLP